MNRQWSLAIISCGLFALATTSAVGQEPGGSSWLDQPAKAPSTPGDWLAQADSGKTIAPDKQAADESAKSEPRDVEKPWEIKIKAYGWIPNYHGTTGVGGQTKTMDVSCNDVFHVLDEVTTMVPVNAEARYGRWGLIVDLYYVRLEDTIRSNGVTAHVRGEQEILELAGFYRVGTWPIGKEPGKISFDMLGGARYNRLQGSVGLQDPSQSVNLGRTVEWWDPFLGPRVTWKPCDKLSLFGRADVGGFGLENSSHFAWQIVAGAEYYITKNMFVEAGYRLLDTDYEQGSGSDRVVYDVTMAGPYMAFGLKF